MQQPPVVSPDGFWMWNGTQWVPNTASTPAPAAVQAPTTSPDGRWMWNGAQWVPNPYQAVVPPYESAGFRSMLTTLFMALNVVGILLLVAFDVLDEIRTGQGAPEGSSLFLATGLVALFAVVGYYGSLIPAVVFFCMWLHRIVRNMPSLGTPNPTFSPGLAVGLCFVPFVNLVQPLLSVLDAWRGSPAQWRWLDRGARRSVRWSPLIAGWWAAWLIARPFTGVGYVLSQDSVARPVFDLIGNILLIIAAVLAIVIVRRLTARQDARNQLIASGQLA